MNDDAIKIANELNELYSIVKCNVERDVHSLINILDDLCVYLARSGEIKANAKFLLNQKRGEVANAYSNVSATILREMLAAECAHEQRLVTLADRLNATITHKIDAVRTMISFEKESMRNAGH